MNELLFYIKHQQTLFSTFFLVFLAHRTHNIFSCIFFFNTHEQQHQQIYSKIHKLGSMLGCLPIAIMFILKTYNANTGGNDEYKEYLNALSTDFLMLLLL